MPPNRFAFVLRLWNETTRPGTNDPPEIRGSLQSSASDEVVYFNSLHQIPALLQELTGWSDTTGDEPPVSD
ncbi:MAG: hypothetical protein GY803_23735 [Chloroflexi bacterium]|nr:hypothetical protein [Chloroflexota bacterium]